MSPYEELVERCAKAIYVDRYPDREWPPSCFDLHMAEDFRGHAREALTETFRTLETVTPEMYAAAFEAMVPNHDAYAAWRSMLRASPIAPPKTDP